MNGLGVNKLFELSKQAKRTKDYKLEKSYLEQAFSLAPTNTKVLNALVRNSRKLGDALELKKWLEKLYKLKPNGEILFELMRLEKREGNYGKVREILVENVRIDPNSKKIKQRLNKAIKATKRKDDNSISLSVLPKESVTNIKSISTILPFVLKEDVVELIRSIRESIYSDADFTSKYNQVVNLLSGQSEEIIVGIMAELYMRESFHSSAINLVKRHKKKLNSEGNAGKIKLVNKLLGLVANKKTEKFNWDDFWRNNVVIVHEEKEPPKILKKIV